MKRPWGQLIDVLACYKVEDPRARTLRRLSRQIAEKADGLIWFEISERVDARRSIARR
jgi:citrate synthase